MRESRKPPSFLKKSPEDTISSGLFRYIYMQWTDRIRQVKILLVIAAVIIAVTSLLVSHYLVKDLSNEERKKMEVWAEALHALNHADENTDLSLVLDVMQGNTTIPVIVLNENGEIESLCQTYATIRRYYRSGKSDCLL